MLVSVSHDRSVRVWEKSEEQVFLEEEQEKRLEAVFDADLDGVRRKASSPSSRLVLTNVIRDCVLL